MAARTFEDSTGARWEVFEVHRASDRAAAVSAGMERGWLAFVKGAEKRRLAPFPADWEVVGTSELERLCIQARLASSSRPVTPFGGATITPPPAVAGAPDPAGAAERDAEGTAPSTPGDAAAVEGAVRAFAHAERTTGVPAVEAMVRLKARLLQDFPGAGHVARDTRRVRRWFVESYYFERPQAVPVERDTWSVAPRPPAGPRSEPARSRESRESR